MMEYPTLTPAALRLRNHVRACVIDEQIVLLDLKRSRYFGLGGRVCRTLLDTIAADGCSPGHTQAGSSDTSVLELLIRQRLLTRERPTSGHPVLPLPRATSTLHAEDDPRSLHINGFEVWRFMIATATAALWLRCRSLQAIADSITARQVKCRPERDADNQYQLRRTVGIFDCLRPLAFTSKDKCLLDSIALVHFLARHKLPTHLVIGVSIRPFMAHAWVQHRCEVLNDTHENVRRFTPILVV